ncbi:SanA/YdcF family protein [Hyalangium rubrum]|uniref:ElyC/SanA/YdcF family protein n=1 Tax=Hyalangium rubrum TaxID=3103134 RepID=A0ABU5HFX2_9BACT|nr:ElyC/SanA/YdcF family protein [Hyalangium sp. s54d21]MDY7232370.1 ElyC/SanA/YdcF family protein [Hyalangium sp. s54d21]
MGRRGVLGVWLRRGLLAGAVALLVVLGLSHLVRVRYEDRIVPLSQAPEAPVALVFGAGLAPGGVPSAVLAQRLDTAVALWKAGRVKAVLVSGDNSDRFHDETRAMRRYLLERGLPEAAVLGDDSGLSTYDSCVRAFTVFQVRQALLVTQRFHLPRALFIANSVGMDAWGVAADEGRPSTRRYAVREMFSRVLALAMVVSGKAPAYPARRTETSGRPGP